MAKTTVQAESAYVHAHVVAQETIDRIRELLQDMPAPGDEPIRWPQVGTMEEAVRRLESVAEFLDGTER